MRCLRVIVDGIDLRMPSRDFTLALVNQAMRELAHGTIFLVTFTMQRSQGCIDTFASDTNARVPRG
jgi:hypothetical protein